MAELTRRDLVVGSATALGLAALPAAALASAPAAGLTTIYPRQRLLTRRLDSPRMYAVLTDCGGMVRCAPASATYVDDAQRPWLCRLALKFDVPPGRYSRVSFYDGRVSRFDGRAPAFYYGGGAVQPLFTFDDWEFWVPPGNGVQAIIELDTKPVLKVGM